MTSSPATINPAKPVLICLLPRHAVKKARGIGDTKLYADIAVGLFPPPVKDGYKSLWPENEVAAVNAARIAGKTDDEIRALVKRLVAARKTATGNEA